MRDFSQPIEPSKADRSAQLQRNDAYQEMAQQQGLLPIKVTPFYQKKIDAEVDALGHFEGPLYRAMYPSLERMFAKAPGEVADWVDDRSNMPSDAAHTLIQKYPDRVLFTPTSICAAHCLYCFRQDVLSEQKNEQARGLDDKLETLIRHLKHNPSVREVILSGGDPLTLSFDGLHNILSRLRSVRTVESIRIHSRAPIFAPQVLRDEAKLKLFAEHKVRFVFHVIHPYEVCEEVEALMQRMYAQGIQLYNQFPLLRKSNDHVQVLLALLQRLEVLHVRTISIFVPEPIYHSAPYRISYNRMCVLMDEVNRIAPPWLTGFRFCLDSAIGKVRREDLVARDLDADTLVFDYQGRQIVYPDFPEAMDVPGDLATMLWKG